MENKRFLDKEGLNLFFNKINNNLINKDFSLQSIVNIIDQDKASLNSPSLTGLPQTPTVEDDTNSQQIATTKFVHSLIPTSSVYLSKIMVIQNPNKMNYLKGDKFDPTGMRVMGFLNDKYSFEIKDYDYSPKEELTENDIFITIFYSFNGIKKRCKLSINNYCYLYNDENTEADAIFWEGLKECVNVANESQLEWFLGKTKSVTLTEEVLGTTTHLVRCIGYNCDRDMNNVEKNTLTFQTANCLNKKQYFSEKTTSVRWDYSSSSCLVKGNCESYYNAFPGKNSIVKVCKKTATGTATYTIRDASLGTTTNTVFLPSLSEMGLSLKDYPSLFYAPSEKEFDKYNTSNLSYQYYTSKDTRLKTWGDSSENNIWYWTRSAYYDDATWSCAVPSNGVCGAKSNGTSLGVAPAFTI